MRLIFSVIISFLMLSFESLWSMDSEDAAFSEVRSAYYSIINFSEEIDDRVDLELIKQRAPSMRIFALQDMALSVFDCLSVEDLAQCLRVSRLFNLYVGKLVHRSNHNFAPENKFTEAILLGELLNPRIKYLHGKEIGRYDGFKKRKIIK